VHGDSPGDARAPATNRKSPTIMPTSTRGESANFL